MHQLWQGHDMTRKTWLLLAAVVAVLAVGAVVTVLIVGSDDEPDRPAARLSDCTRPDRQLLVVFDGNTADADMRTAATALRGDPDIAVSETLTRKQNWTRFQKAFADQPELARLARPEALPATIWLLPADTMEPENLAARLRQDIPEADDVDTAPCDETPAPSTTR
jgi:cell division protein FtsX